MKRARLAALLAAVLLIVSCALSAAASYIVPVELVAAEYKLGTSSPEVLKIKRRMQELGYFSEGAELSGNYNSLMQERIRMFQKDFGIPETGVIDDQFLIALYSEAAARAIQDRRVSKKVAQSVVLFKNSCKTGKYKDILERPNIYWRENLKVRGTILEIVEEDGQDGIMRVQESGDKVWYITFKPGTLEDGVTVGKRVTVYGVCEGVKKYRSVGSGTLTLPWIVAKYIDR